MKRKKIHWRTKRTIEQAAIADYLKNTFFVLTVRGHKLMDVSLDQYLAAKTVVEGPQQRRELRLDCQQIQVIEPAWGRPMKWS